MGKKVTLKYIEDRSKKNSCFSQRKKKLFGKANAMETLTNCRIIVIMQSECGNIYMQSQPRYLEGTQKLMEAWRKYVGSHPEIDDSSDTPINYDLQNGCDSQGEDTPTTQNPSEFNFHSTKSDNNYEMGVLSKDPISDSNIGILKKNGGIVQNDKCQAQTQRIIRYVSKVVGPANRKTPTSIDFVKSPTKKKNTNTPNTPNKERNIVIQQTTPSTPCNYNENISNTNIDIQKENLIYRSKFETNLNSGIDSYESLKDSKEICPEFPPITQLFVQQTMIQDYSFNTYAPEQNKYLSFPNPPNSSFYGQKLSFPSDSQEYNGFDYSNINFSFGSLLDITLDDAVEPFDSMPSRDASLLVDNSFAISGLEDQSIFN